jgi:hypothetical protein
MRISRTKYASEYNHARKCSQIVSMVNKFYSKAKWKSLSFICRKVNLLFIRVLRNQASISLSNKDMFVGDPHRLLHSNCYGTGVLKLR